MFTADWFNSLDKTLRNMGMDSDAQSFDEIKENLSVRKICSPDAFAEHCAYVILAGGFSQKTAKKIHAKIMDTIHSHGADFDTLIALFNNKNKINAICKIWNTRDELCSAYYKLNDTDARLAYLSKLPHIGKITANHLARNLGEDVVKYDIWIQRLGAVYAKNPALVEKIDNGKLDPEIKSACDDMFAHLCAVTRLPRGYIDVVLWKACQVKLISMDVCLQ
ncbi:MAG: hypothetical protein K2M34_04915 [Alphaproteobacteria bacterium]|nr:hypothetical protein [Alphaproteobacteria bacterium]